MMKWEALEPCRESQQLIELRNCSFQQLKPEQFSFLSGEYVSNYWSRGKYRLRRDHVDPQTDCRAAVKWEEQMNARKWPVLITSWNPKILTSSTYNHKLSGHISTKVGFHSFVQCFFSTCCMLGTVLGPRYTISDIKDPVEKRDY